MLGEAEGDRAASRVNWAIDAEADVSFGRRPTSTKSPGERVRPMPNITTPSRQMIDGATGVKTGGTT